MGLGWNSDYHGTVGYIAPTPLDVKIERSVFNNADHYAYYSDLLSKLAEKTGLMEGVTSADKNISDFSADRDFANLTTVDEIIDKWSKYTKSNSDYIIVKKVTMIIFSNTIAEQYKDGTVHSYDEFEATYIASNSASKSLLPMILEKGALHEEAREQKQRNVFKRVG